MPSVSPVPVSATTSRELTVPPPGSARQRGSARPLRRRHDRCLWQPSNPEGDPMRPLLLGTRDGDLRPMNGGAPIGSVLRWLACVAVATSLVACTGGGSTSGGSTSSAPASSDVYSIAVVAS